MGTKSVVGDAAVQYLVKSRAARGNSNAQKWAEALELAVGPSFEKARPARDTALARLCCRHAQLSISFPYF